MSLSGGADGAPGRERMMVVFRREPPRAVLTPCVGVCEVGADGYCLGCARTLDEIAAWGGMPEAERRRLMDDVLPQREAARG